MFPLEEDQKLSFAPNCTARPPPVPLTPVPLPTVPVTYPKVELVSEVLGLVNCGVLVKLNVSALISRAHRSVNLKILESERLSPNSPGPIMMFRPVVPTRTPVGCAKLDWLDQGLPTLIPCST